MKWLDKLAFRFRRYGVRNLMNYLVGGMAAVFVIDLVAPGLNLSFWLSLSREMVLRGQIWRLLTFVFVPTSSSPLFLLLSLYFYWLIGSSLQNQWGTSKFTLYYLIGMLGCILAAAITGYGFNTYLNLSLFLAFAATYPDYQVLLFFVLPVKMKYLALLNVLLFLWQLIVGSWATRLCIVFSLANVLLFFGSDGWNMLRQKVRHWQLRRNYRRNTR